MIRLIVNEREITTDLPPGLPLVDLLRTHERMHGTRVGCREGDCGACSVLVGSLDGDAVRYNVRGACLMPLGNTHGKHIVTIEGLNLDELTPVQQAFVDLHAIQCGFCTPGYVVATAAFYLGGKPLTREHAIDAVAGNICRCTGYKSIERAMERVVAELQGLDEDRRVEWLIEHRFLPPYFRDVPARLAAIEPAELGAADGLIVSGGSDLQVQRPDDVVDGPPRLVHDLPELKRIERVNGTCTVGGAVTFNELRDSDVMTAIFPQLPTYIGRSGSDLVRNMATVGGNIANGSPIGDVSIFFTALGSTLLLRKGDRTRELPIRDCFVGYKTTALEPGELLEAVRFDVPDDHTHYSFEKASKRVHLDMAVVNSGFRARVVDGVIEWADFAVGGLGPTIRYLAETGAFLAGKPIDDDTFREAVEVAQREITPRSRPDYKRLLVRQQLFVHLRRIAPDALTLEALR